jgi:hypothetical protein
MHAHRAICFHCGPFDSIKSKLKGHDQMSSCWQNKARFLLPTSAFCLFVCGYVIYIFILKKLYGTKNAGVIFLSLSEML